MLAYSVILPACNEAQTIENALNAVRTAFDGFGAPYEIIVVDDGSRDGTAALVEDHAEAASIVRLLRHARNLGKGAAVRTGALAARGEWILYLDCDLSVHPSAARKFLLHLANVDVAFGSRRASGAVIAESQPWPRDFLGRLYNAFVRWYLGEPSHDTQCGFKMFHARTRRLFETMVCRGWTFDVELLLRARQAGYRVLELPVTWRHGRVSRVRLRDIWQIAKELREIKRNLFH